jgi:hypothetical protein
MRNMCRANALREASLNGDVAVRLFNQRRSVTQCRQKDLNSIA